MNDIVNAWKVLRLKSRIIVIVATIFPVFAGAMISGIKVSGVQISLSQVISYLTLQAVIINIIISIRTRLQLINRVNILEKDTNAQVREVKREFFELQNTQRKQKREISQNQQDIHRLASMLKFVRSLLIDKYGKSGNAN